jgi:hypothetical protein
MAMRWDDRCDLVSREQADASRAPSLTGIDRYGRRNPRSACAPAHPDRITVAAVAALNRVNVFFRPPAGSRASPVPPRMRMRTLAA